MPTKDELLDCVCEYLGRSSMPASEIARDLVRLERMGAPWPVASAREWTEAIDHGLRTIRLVSDGLNVRLAVKLTEETKKDVPTQMSLFGD